MFSRIEKGYGVAQQPLVRGHASRNADTALSTDHASQNTETGISIYRTLRPWFLNYLVKVERNGRIMYQYEPRPVGPTDSVPIHS